MIYLVSCDFRRPIMGSSNIPFTQALEQSRGWWHFIENTWLISTPENIQQFSDRLQPYVRGTDKIIIMKFSEEYTGWLTDDAWDWIRERINTGELFQ